MRRAATAPKLAVRLRSKGDVKETDRQAHPTFILIGMSPRLRGGALCGLLGMGVLCGCQGSGEVPDTGPGSWTAAGALPIARFEAIAVVLAGRIYYMGGITGTFGDQSSARESDRVDVYDPLTATWAAGPSLPAGGPRHHLAAAVEDDKIYLLGGFVGILGGADVAGVFTPNAKSYVLDGGQWRALADQPVARGAATAQAIGGAIYVAGGGITEPDARSDLYAYHPLGDFWTSQAPMTQTREHVASCTIGKRMIVVGGWRGKDRSVVAAAEAYDPVADRWQALPDMPTARGGLGAAGIGNVCFVVGGERWDGDLPGTFARNEGFDTVGDAWTRYQPMRSARHGLGLVAVGDGLFAIGGGPVRGNSYTTVVESFRP